MKTKILMLMVLLGLTTASIAQPKENVSEKTFREPKHEMRMDGERRGPSGELNLTDAQKELFKKSRLDVQKQIQPLRNELGEAEAHQQTLVTAEKPDLAAINNNIEKIGGLKIEIAKVQAKHRLDMRAQLTEEQRLKFDAFKGHMRDGEGRKGHERME